MKVYVIINPERKCCLRAETYTPNISSGSIHQPKCKLQFWPALFHRLLSQQTNMEVSLFSRQTWFPPLGGLTAPVILSWLTTCYLALKSDFKLTALAANAKLQVEMLICDPTAAAVTDLSDKVTFCSDRGDTQLKHHKITFLLDKLYAQSGCWLTAQTYYPYFIMTVLQVLIILFLCFYDVKTLSWLIGSLSVLGFFSC